MTQTGTNFDAKVDLIPGAQVATDLRTKANYILKVSSVDGNGPIFAIGAAVTDRPGGILQRGVNGSSVTKSAEVAHRGISRVIGGAAITAGQRIQMDGSGKAIVAAATGYAFGYALSSITADGEMLTVCFDCAGANLVA